MLRRRKRKKWKRMNMAMRSLGGNTCSGGLLDQRLTISQQKTAGTRQSCTKTYMAERYNVHRTLAQVERAALVSTNSSKARSAHGRRPKRLYARQQ